MSAFSDAAKRNKKPRPRMLDKTDKRNKVAATDRRENEKVQKRSGGRCEVMTVVDPVFAFDARTMRAVEPQQVVVRCRHRAVGAPHHLIYGIGRRNVGRSILAAHKIAVCRKCHAEITGHVLKIACDDARRYDARTVYYERVE